MKFSQTNCTGNCPKCNFFNFSDSFFDEMIKLADQNRFESLVTEKRYVIETWLSTNGL